MSKKAKWTILTYIAAHNNLSNLGTISRKQIVDTGSSDELKLVVLYDGKSGSERLVVGKPRSIADHKSLTDFNSGDANQLLETVKWAYKKCPAEKYGLILWSHGSGWQPEQIKEVASEARGDDAVTDDESSERSSSPGSQAIFRQSLTEILRKDTESERAICFDDGSSQSLDTLQLGQVTAEIQKMIGQPLDLLGMDACLMASTEVAYQLRNSVRYMVASQELVPGHSWPYQSILSNLREQPDMSAKDLSIHIVDQYADHYQQNPPTAGDVTKVAVDLSKVNQLVEPIATLADTLLADFDNQSNALWTAQRQSQIRELNKEKRKLKETKFHYHLWDIGSVCKVLAEKTESDIIKAAAHDTLAALAPGNSAVLAERHVGKWFDDIGGLSIYMASPVTQRLTPYYQALDFGRETKWSALLEKYHEAHASPF